MKAIRMAGVMILALLAVGMLAGPALAQGGGEVEETSWVEAYIVAGGWIGFVILFCSFVSLALIIEHIVNIKRDKIVPPQLIDEIEGMFENEELVCPRSTQDSRP
jgi:hypothetical protein